MNGFDLSTISNIYVGSTQYSSIYLGSTLLWPVNQSLPYDAELEYLESTGYPYIDTGLYNDSSTIIDMKMSAAGKDRLNGSEYSSSYRYKWGANGNGYVYYGFGGNNYTSSMLFDIDSPCTFYLKQGLQYVKDSNDNTLLSSSGTFSTFSPQTIKIFRCNSGGGFVNLNGDGQIRIYYCNITNSTTQIELIPVRVGNVGYMYDKISGQLFENKGSDSFVLGPDKDVPVEPTEPEFIEIEYLLSSGSLYIETGIIPDANTGIHIKASWNSGSDNYIVGLRNTSGDTRWCIGKNNYGWYWGYGTYTKSYYGNFDNYLNATATTDIIEYKLNYLNDSKWYGEGSNNTLVLQTLPTLSFTPSYNIRLFGSAGVSADYSKFSGKLYFVKISQGQNVIMDLIPVRVGQVGYMYDKISGLLYANAGTGEFIVGPDKL